MCTLATCRCQHAPALEGREQAGCELRVFAVERQNGVGDEVVAGPIGTVEFLVVSERKGMNERPHAVGIGERERAMPGECLDAAEGPGFGAECRPREPFV